MNYLVIEGNIGAGKTSLANMIAKDFNARPVLERFADNPFLPKFYANPERYSFPLELSFLAERYNQLKKELSSRDLFSNFVVADYYFMKSLIFASNTLPVDELALYRQLFDIVYSSIPKPDLFVYLHVPVNQLQSNIKKRGRDYEQAIKNEYLEKIQTGYFAWFKQQNEIPVLILDNASIDFVNNKADYKRITETIFDKNWPVGINRMLF
ncbi:MAG: deoxynucleoside kinase [Bacteroidales bacterium]|nr:deoxynucleoside kinase [Bacteroidales bacterium]